MSSLSKLVCIIHQNDAIVHDDAHQHDDADEGHDTQCRTGNEKRPGYTNDGKGNREQNDERIEKRFKLRRHDHVCQNHGDEKRDS